MAQVLLHHAQIAAGAPMQLYSTGMTECMRVKLWETRPPAEGLDDLPDPVVGHTTLLPVASAGAVTHHEHRVLTATTNPLLREVLGQDGFRLTFAFWGVGTFIPTYVGTVAAKSGLSAAEWAGLAGLVTSVGGVAGFISLGFLADAVGRKPVAMLFYFMCLILTPVVYLWAHNVRVLLFLVGFFTQGIWAWAPIWLPELFPTHIRATAVAFSFNAPRFISCVGPLIAGGLIVGLGGYGRAATIVGLFFTLGLVAAPFLPETKGKPLPETVTPALPARAN
ncbi:MAG: hypothetical protein DME00_34905 [Candidatus Rokuibacteriota bacterium]|nr:MAG: hypothetical protein DME00_34905 [Candidatus Rokubacteria bacterium]